MKKTLASIVVGLFLATTSFARETANEFPAMPIYVPAKQMQITDEMPLEVDGRITNPKEYDRFLRLPTRTDTKRIAEDGRIDAIEILAMFPERKPHPVNTNNVCDEGQYKREEQIRYDRQLGPGKTRYTPHDEVEWFLLERMCQFFEDTEGHPTLDVLAAFEKQEATLLRRLRDAMAEQAYVVDRVRGITGAQYTMKGTTKDYEIKAYDNDKEKIGRPVIYKHGGKIIVYFNRLTEEEKEQLYQLTRQYQRKIGKPLTMHWDGITTEIRTKGKTELQYEINVRRFSHFNEDPQNAYRRVIRIKRPIVGPFKLIPLRTRETTIAEKSR